MFLQILQLCTVTLSLFETLVGLNCEDVMLWLVFRHLIPMDHLVPCQRPSIKQPDLHGRASERYVSTSIEIQNTTFKSLIVCNIFEKQQARFLQQVIINDTYMLP